MQLPSSDPSLSPCTSLTCFQKLCVPVLVRRACSQRALGPEAREVDSVKQGSVKVGRSATRKSDSQELLAGSDHLTCAQAKPASVQAKRQKRVQCTLPDFSQVRTKSAARPPPLTA